MVTVHINVDTSNLKVTKNGENFKNKLLDQLSRNAKIILEKNTPRQSGRGANNYKITKSGDKHEVSNNAHYLIFPNIGTGIYGARHAPIRPKRAKVLHFHWKGREWFLKSVKGQKPQKFVERSTGEIIRSIESSLVIAKKGTLE